MKIDKDILQLPIVFHLLFYILLLPLALFSDYDFNSLIPIDSGLIIADIFLLITCFKKLKYYTIISAITIFLLNVITEIQLRVEIDYTQYYIIYSYTIVVSVLITTALFLAKQSTKNANMDTTFD